MQIAKTLAAAAVLTAMSALTAVLVLAALDPACGSDGHSQKAWLNELQADVVALFNK